MTPTNTAELRELKANATHGAVKVAKDSHGASVRSDCQYELKIAWLSASSSFTGKGYRQRSDAAAFADAQYIAALWNAAPAMIDELEQARERVKELEADRAALKSILKGYRINSAFGGDVLQVCIAFSVGQLREMGANMERVIADRLRDVPREFADALDPRKQGAEL